VPITSLTSYFNTSSFGDTNTYTRNQQELALTLDSAAHELANWKSLIAMSAGGGAFEGGRLLASTFLNSVPVLSAIPLLTKAVTFFAGALADTSLTRLINQAFGNAGEEESFFDQITSQGSVRLMGLVGMGQSFAVMQLLQGFASVSRGMICEENLKNKNSGFLHHLILGLQCHFGSGMFAGLTQGVVGAVEQRMSLRTKNINGGELPLQKFRKIVLERFPNIGLTPAFEGTKNREESVSFSKDISFPTPVERLPRFFSKAVRQASRPTLSKTLPKPKRMLPGPWVTTTVSTQHGTFEVTHRASHDPELLIETIRQTPTKESQKRRKVFKLIDDPKGRKVGTREYYGINKATQKFGFLITAFEGKVAVEIPIALIVNSERGGRKRSAIILSLWKERTRTLADYLLDPPFTKEQENLRVFICRRVLRKVRRLHQLGLIHGDLCPKNIIIDQCLLTYFVDFEFLRKGTPSEREGEMSIAIGGLASQLMADRRYPLDKFRGIYEDRKKQISSEEF